MRPSGFNSVEKCVRRYLKGKHEKETIKKGMRRKETTEKARMYVEIRKKVK
jgi:methyltransferase-like protein